MSDENKKISNIYVLTEEIAVGSYDERDVEIRVHGAFLTYQGAWDHIVSLTIKDVYGLRGLVEPVTIDTSAHRFVVTPVEVK